MSRFRPIRLSMLLLAVLLAGRSASAAVRDFTVEEFNDPKNRREGVEVRVEGRVSTYSGQMLRLKYCDLPFYSPTDLPPRVRSAGNIEVTGVVEPSKTSGRPQFTIRSVRETPSDLDRYLAMRREIRKDDAEGWYELARWADKRGMFYKDQELLARSDEARLRGFEIERKTAARENPQDLLKLAARAKEVGVSDAVRQELVHSAYQLQWSRLKSEPVEKLSSLAEGIARDLPGSTEPLPFAESELTKAYAEHPLEAYRTADAAARRKMHRLLYGQVLLRTLMPKLAADGSNGFELADEIDKLLPEQHKLAETYRDKALAARAAMIEKLPRREVLALVEQYRGRRQPQEANQLLESWLTLRRRKLNPDDTEGLLQLTEEYRTLLNRSDLANRWLIEAHMKNPNAADIEEKLTQLGYRLVDGVWMSDLEFNARPEGRLDRAIREGRVEAGMTAAQVRRSLGEPLSFARAATAGQIVELWTYGLTDTSRLTIRLVKTRRQQEATVADVSETKSQ